MNQWFSDDLSIQGDKVLCNKTGSKLQIISSDVGSSYGALADFIVADELCHWTKHELWHSLLSTSAKRSHTVLLAISNAGWLDSWAWKAREAVRQDPRWYFSRLDGPTASWISAAELEGQRRHIPGFQFARLWLNEWSVGVDSPLVSEEDLARSITIETIPEVLDAAEGPFIGGLDIGVKKDHTAFVIVGCNLKGPRLKLLYVKTWDPAKFGGNVPLHLVEKEVQDSYRGLRMRGVAFDPHQGLYLAQRLAARGVAMLPYAWNSTSKAHMAQTAYEAFAHRRIDLFHCDELIRDIRRVQYMERMGRMTFDMPHDEAGHGDVFAAFAMALVWAFGTRADETGDYSDLPRIEAVAT